MHFFSTVLSIGILPITAVPRAGTCFYSTYTWGEKDAMIFPKLQGSSPPLARESNKRALAAVRYYLVKKDFRAFPLVIGNAELDI